MSDRASNEKLADKLLNEWRDEILTLCDDDQKQEVHHFHCMAHVLLGFHRYACNDLKLHETSLVGEKGPLGRDSLPVFKFWRTKGTIVERVLRTTSETFGPVGDHHGLRDRWESHCAMSGIKSVVGNYRDNRFNAIFQTAAEVFVHTDDFLNVIESVKTPNLKLKSVEADLKSNIIRALIQVFGLVYVKITGPYWNLVTSGKVAYMELYYHIQEMTDFLKRCSSEPALLINKEGHWSSTDPLEISFVPNKQRFVETLFIIKEDTSELLFDTIKLVTSAMQRTIEKQLVDFLPGGKFGEAPQKTELARTSFAHVTNLGCEHYFGDLDSSQKRRPNASMHHHSSVQLLKRNRVPLIKWLERMPSNQRRTLFKSARKGGRVLRKKHMDSEKNVINEIGKMMNTEKTQKANPKKRRKTNKNDVPELEVNEYDYEEEVNQITSELPTIEGFNDNEYVAVAYQDSWYPGCVVKSVDSDSALINFMTPCRKPGYYAWPSRVDQQVVRKDFVLKRGFIPQCVNSGRQWFFAENTEIKYLYDKYSKVFF